MMRAGVRGAAALVAVLALAGGAAATQELSEKSVKAFMDYAWSLTPQKFTRPDGRSVEIDKTDRSKNEVPIEVAREVIMAGRLTAHAQMCELLEDQVNNYRSLMKREDEKKKWTEQQLIYINQLHLTTVMLLTGKIRLVEQQDGGKEVVLEESKSNEAQTCTDEQRKKVKDLIAVYIKSGPPLTTASSSAGGALPPATPASAPAQEP
ncbi:MAG TPA: hypothetical protein VE665_03140 [Hyphomicrobiaceae bacterium]|jgi:hypothetical protein|nr:hypothetical protein [Hyphomicrobiaceae bacterium]